MHKASYRMPAEFEAQNRVWFAWPHRKEDWPGKFAPIPYVFAEMLRVISQHQRVGLIVKDEKAKESARLILDQGDVKLSMIDFVVAPSNRGWMRDSGSIFVTDKNGEKAALGFGFNAWAKYPNYKLDAALPAVMAKKAKVKLVQPTHKKRHVVLEGGGIEVNGAGSIIVTEEWLLSDSQVRNPGFTRDDYEAVFAQYLGAPHTIWLGHGIVGDDTHGHVDDITRFADETTILTVVETDKKDANYTLLRDNVKRLKAARSVRGKAFDVVELPMPRTVIYEGERLPASYANFLITNKTVLVPTFNDVHDRTALNIISDAFPGRDVVGIFARDLVWGLGTIHCLSQQEPA